MDAEDITAGWAENERGRLATDGLAWLQAWRRAMALAAGEARGHVTLETLDDPGWTLTVDLAGTPLAGRPFARVHEERDQHDWRTVTVEADVLEASCGPLGLGEVLSTLRAWATEVPEVATLVAHNGLRGVGPNLRDDPPRWRDEDLWPRLDAQQEDDRQTELAELDGTHLAWLQAWYALHCDDWWEHSFGVSVRSTDEGWELFAELMDTVLFERPFREVRRQTGPHWVRAWVDDGTFRAEAAPLDLGEAIAELRGFVRSLRSPGRSAYVVEIVVPEDDEPG